MSAEPKPFVVFDFDHTLYDGDSGSHLIYWLLRRSLWRTVLALLITPVCGPMIAFMPTRRRGISAFVWVGTLGVRSLAAFNCLIDAYVLTHKDELAARLLPVALNVLRGHLAAGDEVIIATGAPPELARAILAFVEHTPVPVIGTVMAPGLGGMLASQHCHYKNKMRMIRAAGFTRKIDTAYSDSRADLPLLIEAENPVVVNPNAKSVPDFQRVLGANTPILNWGCKDRAGTSMPT